MTGRMDELAAGAEILCHGVWTVATPIGDCLALIGRTLVGCPRAPGDNGEALSCPTSSGCWDR